MFCSLDKYLLTTYYVLIFILDAGDASQHKISLLVLWSLLCPLPGEFLARNPGGLASLPHPSLACSLSPLSSPSPSPSVSQARVWGSYRTICSQGVLLSHLSGEMDWRAAVAGAGGCWNAALRGQQCCSKAHDMRCRLHRAHWMLWRRFLSGGPLLSDNSIYVKWT